MLAKVCIRLSHDVRQIHREPIPGSKLQRRKYCRGERAMLRLDQLEATANPESNLGVCRRAPGCFNRSLVWWSVKDNQYGSGAVSQHAIQMRYGESFLFRIASYLRESQRKFVLVLVVLRVSCEIDDQDLLGTNLGDHIGQCSLQDFHRSRRSDKEALLIPELAKLPGYRLCVFFRVFNPIQFAKAVGPDCQDKPTGGTLSRGALTKSWDHRNEYQRCRNDVPSRWHLSPLPPVRALLYYCTGPGGVRANAHRANAKGRPAGSIRFCRDLGVISRRAAGGDCCGYR